MKIREICNKVLANYRLTSLTISGLIFLIFLLFTMKVKIFQFEFNIYPFEFNNYLYVSIAMSISIGYQYAIIKNSLSRIRPTFGKLDCLFQIGQYQVFSQDLEKKLHKSWLCYLTIIIVVLPFAILELITEPSYFYLFKDTLWYRLFDIFNFLIKYLNLFLMGIIIWIMITLALIVNELKEKYTVNIDVFDVDETGGLKPLRLFVLSIVSNYFIIIALAIISCIQPITLPPITWATLHLYIHNIITSEIIILILMFLIGVILFITTQQTTRKLIDKGVKLELIKINRKYKETYDKVTEISSRKGNNDNEKELEKLRVILDLLEKEEVTVNRIKHKRFDLRVIFTFITTALIPLITLIEKITGFAGSK